MLKIIIDTKNDYIRAVTFSGHAMYDDYGKDIVCSASSSIMTTTVNGCLSLVDKSLEVIQQKDIITINVFEENDIVNTLLINMIDLLKQLENDYPKNIKIN